MLNIACGRIEQMILSSVWDRRKKCSIMMDQLGKVAMIHATTQCVSSMTLRVTAVELNDLCI